MIVNVTGRERAGRPIATAVVQVAAICACRLATLATRNTGDFESTGINLVNPWRRSAGRLRPTETRAEAGTQPAGATEVMLPMRNSRSASRRWHQASSQ